MPEDSSYVYQDNEYDFHMREFRPPAEWPGLEHGALVGGAGGHGEQLHQRAGHVVKQTLSVPSVSQDGGPEMTSTGKEEGEKNKNVIH